tara:strand:+ start:297 stop:512 length:216 start_codon:yes stop_codon:yes gene_type:complete
VRKKILNGFNSFIMKKIYVFLLGHWEPGNEMIKVETELFPFLKEIESNWPKIFKNFSILNDNQNKIINNWN